MKLIRLKHMTPCMQMFCFLHTIDFCMGTKDKHSFFLMQAMVHIIYAIKIFDLMHTPGLLGRVKRSGIEIVQISII